MRIFSSLSLTAFFRQTLSLVCATSLVATPYARAAGKEAAAAPTSGPAATAASATKAETQVNEIHGLNGTNVAFLMAASCKEENWAKFAPWAKKVGFFKKELPPTFRFSSTKESVKAEGFDVSAKYASKKGIEITYKGVTTTAPDVCSAILKTFGDLGAKKSAWIGAVLPTAHAEEPIFREEGKDADLANAVSYGAIGTFAAISGGLVLGAGIAPVLGIGAIAAGAYGLYMSYTNYSSAHTKEAFDEIMNTMLSLQCNKAGTFIKTMSYRVSVRKVPPPPKMDVYDIDSGATSAVINTDYAKKSRDTILSIASRCNSAQDAEKIMAQYNQLRERAAAKVSAAEDGRPVPGTEVETAEPPAPKGARAPQSDDSDDNDDDD